MPTKLAPKKAAPKAAAKKAPAMTKNDVCAPYKPSAKERAEQDRWRARDDLRTLQQAAELAQDKGRLKAAQNEAAKQMQALAAVSKRK